MRGPHSRELIVQHGPPPGSSADARRPRRAAARAAGVLGAVALLFPGGEAVAQDTPEVSVDAYGTLGVVHSSEDRADFVWNPTRPGGPGHAETVSAAVDSRLGGQLTLRATPELTAVVQAVAEQDHEGEYRPGLEWAYVQYAFTPDLSVRAGRTPLSAFMVSEYRKVSYANPWMRPPVELYGLSPVFSIDGLELTHELRSGGWTNRLSVGFGRTESDFAVGFAGDRELVPGEGTAEAENTWILDNTVRRGSFSLRAAFATGLLDIDAFDPFFDALRSFGAEGRELADRYELDGTPFEFAAVGAEHDPGPWFGMAEAGWVDFDSALGEKLAGYVTGGYRAGPLTPYATYSRVEVLSETSTAGLSVAGLPPEAAQAASELSAGLDLFLNAAPVQQNLAFGTRWDVSAGVALKAQVDFVDLLEDSPGTFDSPRPGFEPGGSARLISVATAFVF